MHCESFPLRKLCSSLALSSRDGSLVSAPCGLGAASAEAAWWLKSWGLQMELVELISNLAVNPLLAMSSSMEVDMVSVEASVSEASSSLSPVYEELLEVVTLATVKLRFDWPVGKQEVACSILDATSL